MPKLITAKHRKLMDNVPDEFVDGILNQPAVVDTLRSQPTRAKFKTELGKLLTDTLKVYREMVKEELKCQN